MAGSCGLAPVQRVSDPGPAGVPVGSGLTSVWTLTGQTAAMGFIQASSPKGTRASQRAAWL